MIGDKSCKTCVFWSMNPNSQRPIGERNGQCRAHAPVFAVVDDRPGGRWPMTREDDCCGDHATVESLARADGDGA